MIAEVSGGVVCVRCQNDDGGVVGRHIVVVGRVVADLVWQVGGVDVDGVVASDQMVEGVGSIRGSGDGVGVVHC